MLNRLLYGPATPVRFIFRRIKANFVLNRYFYTNVYPKYVYNITVLVATRYKYPECLSLVNVSTKYGIYIYRNIIILPQISMKFCYIVNDELSKFHIKTLSEISQIEKDTM